MTFVEVQELFGTTNIPGSPQELEVLRHWTEELVSRKGEKYVRKYRKRLYRVWLFILQMGLTRV